MKLNRLFILLSLSLTLLPGCSCSQNEEENTEQTNNNTPTTKTYERIEKSVGKSGGKIGDESNGVVLNIPEGALKEDTSISAQYTIEAGTFSKDPTMNFLCGVEFGPSGTVFDKPVDISMHLDKKPINDELSIYCYDEENDIWDFTSTGTISGENVTFQITHFSKYKCLDLKKSTFDQYVYIVRDAQRTGKSDSWITETYLDYLLNDIHIMDYYSDFMGHVYEPKGFLFNGMYQIGDKSHDPDATIYRYGESGYVSSFSSKCGYTIDASALSSYAEFLKEREKAAVENQEIISISLTVYFKMVKPIIDLSAQKTELKKGESTIVNVRCHYEKPENFFPENRTINLAYYELTLPWEQKHIKTNVTEFKTDEDGAAQFEVRSKDGETETIKVMFYVDGTFGEYADAYIEFTGKERNGFNFTGHISAEYSYEFEVGNPNPGSMPENGLTNVVNVHTLNTITITMSYDINGWLSFVDENDFRGIINIENVEAHIDSTLAVHDLTQTYTTLISSTTFHDLCEFNFFESTTEPKIKTIKNAGIEGSWYDNEYSTYKTVSFDEGVDRSDFIIIDGNGYWHEMEESSESGVEKDEEAYFGVRCKLFCVIPFYTEGVKLQEGTQTNDIDVRGGPNCYETTDKTHNWPSYSKNHKQSGSQTISFTKRKSSSN